jgi:hypothetical protein
MLSKKTKIVLTALAATASVGALVGCSDTIATPTNDVYNASILNLDDVTYNTMSRIYDAVVSEGDTNSEKVLNNILYIYAQGIYGPFYDVTKKDGTVVKGLNTVVPAYLKENSAVADIQAIADAYSIYDGKIANVVRAYEEILYRIRSVFLTYVTNSSYQIRTQFIEKKFYDAQTKAFYVLGKKTDGSPACFTAAMQVDGAYHLNESAIETGKIVLDAEGSDALAGKAYFYNIFSTYKTYIEASVLPDIYRSELVSQYLYKTNRNTIGNSYARKVASVKLADNAAFPTATKDLVRAYCKDVIAANLYTAYPFSFLNDLYKGTVTSKKYTADELAFAKTVYADANWTSDNQDDPETPEIDLVIPAESTYGADLKNYAELKIGADAVGGRNVSSSIDDIWKDYTNSGAYSPETGLAIKRQTLLSVDNSTRSWGTSSSGFDTLGSSAKTRLLKMGVANEVDSLTEAQKSEIVPLTYGYYVYDHYFLTPEGYESSNAYPYAIYESSNWYLINVEEAVKGSKLMADGTSNYDHLVGEGYTEYIARKVAYTMSSSDTYKKSANKYYVDEMAVTYHDTSLYNYFKTTFPDLFD